MIQVEHDEGTLWGRAGHVGNGFGFFVIWEVEKGDEVWWVPGGWGVWS